MAMKEVIEYLESRPGQMLIPPAILLSSGKTGIRDMLDRKITKKQMQNIARAWVAEGKAILALLEV